MICLLNCWIVGLQKLMYSFLFPCLETIKISIYQNIDFLIVLWHQVKHLLFQAVVRLLGGSGAACGQAATARKREQDVRAWQWAPGTCGCRAATQAPGSETLAERYLG